MNLEYANLVVPKGKEHLKPNYESFNNLLGSLEVSGVFSDKLIQKVYNVSIQIIDLKHLSETDKYTKDELDEKYMKYFKMFHNIFRCYNIFSQEFKSDLLEHFHGIYN